MSINPGESLKAFAKRNLTTVLAGICDQSAGGADQAGAVFCLGHTVREALLQDVLASMGNATGQRSSFSTTRRLCASADRRSRNLIRSG